MLVYATAVLFFAGVATCFGIYAVKPKLRMKQQIAAGFAIAFLALASLAIFYAQEVAPFALIGAIVVPGNILVGRYNPWLRR